MNRRELLQAGMSAAMLGIAGPVLADEMPSQHERSPSPPALRDRICLFTDLIDDFDYSYDEVAKMLQQLQIAGADLTVRSGGLVPPERAAEELPKVAAAFREHGLSIPMLSTNINAADDPVTPAILTAMQQLGIRFYKLGYYHYGDLPNWKTDLDATRQRLQGLIKLGKEAGVIAGIHNHAGPTVGAAMWDLVMLLESLDGKWVGSYFDPAHATIEGGQYGWKLGLQRLAPHIKMIAIKDFVWQKEQGGWRPRWCPLGEGLVRWSEFFRLLNDIEFSGPISLHIEYDPGGNDRAARLENSLAAAERDLKFLREKIEEAGNDKPSGK